MAIDGDLVFVHALYKNFMDREHAVVDIFRVNEEGKILEHWDVFQPVPEPDQFANDNTMF